MLQPKPHTKFHSTKGNQEVSTETKRDLEDPLISPTRQVLLLDYRSRPALRPLETLCSSGGFLCSTKHEMPEVLDTGTEVQGERKLNQGEKFW